MGTLPWSSPPTEEARMKSIHPSRELAKPHPTPEWFSGPVFVHALNDAGASTELKILAVYFDAGSRTKPHRHSTEQLLYFLEGEGDRRGPDEPSPLSGRRHGGDPGRGMALARSDPGTRRVSPLDPAGRAVHVATRRAHGGLGFLHERDRRRLTRLRPGRLRRRAEPRADGFTGRPGNVTIRPSRGFVYEPRAEAHPWSRGGMGPGGPHRAGPREVARYEVATCVRRDLGGIAGGGRVLRGRGW